MTNFHSTKYDGTMSIHLPVQGVDPSDSELPEPSPAEFRRSLLHHLRYTVGTDAQHATKYDWRIALTHSIRDRATQPWFQSTRRTWAEDRKRVYYLSMEFLIGRLLEDATINLGLREIAAEVFDGLGIDFQELMDDEPDAALGNGGLGRLAACYLESMSTVGCPAYGYGLRYEHGLFRQSFSEDGQQIESPEDWLTSNNPWDFTRPEAAYPIGFHGEVKEIDGKPIWRPYHKMEAEAHDIPVVGWQGRWANTLRLWAAKPTANLFDLERFNAGEFMEAAEPEALARTLSRVLYPNDSTDLGKRLRLAQEYLLTSASVQDILRRFLDGHTDLRELPKYAAIQMNDTHPAIAGPELIRLLVDDHGFDFTTAVDTTTQVLGYTNHTLLPEALEKWSVDLVGSLLPRHLQIIEQLDRQHVELHPGRSEDVGLITDGQVRMGDLAFVTSHNINGVSALHTDLVRENLFPELNQLHPGRIVNVTNGITPRRWLKLANPPLAKLITETIGDGWEDDLDKLRALEPYAEDPAFQQAFALTKQEAKDRFADWALATHGLDVPTDALFDVQAKRLHEYKRQLLNILQTIAHYQRIKADPSGNWQPRVKLFGGKAAPSYDFAKLVIRLINDVGTVVNNDPDTNGLLRVIYPPNYNVSMAEKLIPAANLSEQISTAGMEASGTGNMKFALNGALTIGTLDGANVEIREQVGADNFFLFGLEAAAASQRRHEDGHSHRAIEHSLALRGVLDALGSGVFSPDDPGRYQEIVDKMWNNDWFLVTDDFDAYDAAQARVDEAYRDQAQWNKMAILNTARMGFFSSDRAVAEYMQNIWNVERAI
ncbi:MAG: glycogen/starch/alpha-glucan phosphorylase [Candidatus Nanopelagicales bacterium]